MSEPKHQAQNILLGAIGVGWLLQWIFSGKKELLDKKLEQLKASEAKYDYVIVFESSPKTEHVREFLYNKLKSLGFNVEVHNGVQPTPQKSGQPTEPAKIYFHLAAPFALLLKKAEEKELKKERTSNGERFDRNRSDQVFVKKPIDLDHIRRFRNYDDESLFFSSSERQGLISSLLLEDCVAKEEDVGKWKSDDKNPLDFYVGEPIIGRFRCAGLLNFFPIHSPLEREITFFRWSKNILFHDLDGMKTCNDFGEEIAWYYAWLSFYTRWLIVPSIISVLIYFFTTEETSSLYAFYYSVFLMVWSTLFVEFWKRRESEIAWEWGISRSIGDDEFGQLQRSEYVGVVRHSPITNKLERYSPGKIRVAKYYLVSVPVMALILLVAAAWMVAIFELEEYITKHYSNGYWYLIPLILICVEIFVMNLVYKLISTKLNDFENYETYEEHENNLIFKNILFEYLNSFGSFFYIAFYIRDFHRLQTQLIGLLVTKQLFQNVTETFVPWMIEKFKKKDKLSIERSEREYQKPVMESMYDDWAEMILQYGYIIQFGSAFPLASFFSFINNLVEIRTDAFKMFYTFQRPNPAQRPNIGIYLKVLEVIATLGVITNCLLMAYTVHEFCLDQQHFSIH